MAVWHGMDMRRRLIVLAATAFVFIAVLALSNMASKPNLSLLYAGLEGAQSGEIVTALEQRGVDYDVRGDSIYVDATRRDELRMTLAAEGLPAIGGAGYELLDSMSGFGTTSQMFDAAYWRAKEGELARTILANPQIRAARVHIANGSSNAFRRSISPTASVYITSANGTIAPQQARAFKYLVASAISGMLPEDVAIIDSQGGLISSGEDAPGAATQDRAAEIKQNVERLLEARVGRGNAVVEVSVQTAMESETITERTIDPDSRIAISTDATEKTDSSQATDPPNVTVASNLPEGDAANGGESQSSSSETRERTNYEVSETRREISRQPGALKKLSVAVLVNDIAIPQEDGTITWTPRPQEELAQLQTLVASAVGYDESRGDVVTLQSMQFEPLAIEGTSATGGFMGGQPLDIMQLVQLGVIALVALILGLFVMRPILMQRASASLPAPDTTNAQAALTGEIADDDSPMPDLPMLSGFDGGTSDDLDMPFAMGNAFESEDDAADPVDRLKRLIEERRDETVEILRSWMDDKERQG